MALTKITPQMFDTSATAHDLNVDNGTFVVDGSASRVGIGTATPSTLLDVNGTATATTFVGALTGNVTGNLTGTILTAAQTNITSVGTLSNLTTSGFAKADNYQFYQNSSATGVTDAIYRKTTATLAFKTGSTERMTLDGSGNLVVTGGITTSGAVGFRTSADSNYAFIALQNSSLTHGGYMSIQGGTATGLEINASASSFSGTIFLAKQSQATTGGYLARFANSAGD